MEFKLEVVAYAKKNNNNNSKAARDYNVSRSCIIKWLNKEEFMLNLSLR